MCVCARTGFPYVYTYILQVYIPSRMSVRIYIMSEFQVSAADTFLRRSRSRGNYFGSMADTRGPLYSTRFRCGIFILSCAQDAREQYRDRCRQGSFYERCSRLIRENFYATLSLHYVMYFWQVISKFFIRNLIVIWSENIFLTKMSIFQ